MSEFTIDDLKKRDEGALAGFHQYLAPKVRALVARLLYKRHELEVDDVANEVFLRLFSRLDLLTTFDTTLKVERYCLRAAHNIAVEELAKLKRDDAIVQSYESQLETQAQPKLDRRVEELERLENVRKFLPKLLVSLSPLERQLLQMELEGMNVQEISRSLGMAIPETRYSLQALRAKIRYRSKRMLKNSSTV